MSKQKYVLTQRPQLIDLNKTFKNFKLQFQVVSLEPNKDFYALVLNQDQLDTTDLNTVEMKHAKGKIGGTITADTDKYQNYFLVLKSLHPEDNTEVEVSTHLEEIEPRPQQATETSTTSESFVPPVANTPSSSDTNNATVETTKSLFRNPWFWAAVIVMIAVAGYYYYYYVYKKNVPRSLPPSSEIFQGEEVEGVSSQPVQDYANIMVAPAKAEDMEVVSNHMVAPARRKNSKKDLYNKLSQIA